MNEEEKQLRSGTTAATDLLRRSVVRLEGVAQRLSRRSDYLSEWTVRSIVEDLRAVNFRQKVRGPADRGGGSGARPAASDPPASNPA